MNIIQRRRSLLAGLALLIALAFSSPALAAAPTVETFEDVMTNNVLVNCDGFDIIENARRTIRIVTFYDNAGDPVRVQVHVKYQGTLANSVTGKTVVDGPDAFLAVEDIDGTFHLHGLLYSINIPGEGVAVLDAGTITFYPDGSVVVHGPHQVYAGGNQVLCGALD
jgi:hypothetical protein